MRIFIRIMGLTTIGMCICLMLMHLLDLNVRKDEIEKISNIAMSNTQIIMQENIEDLYYGTSNARMVVDNNDKYEKLYKDSLLKLQTTNGNYSLNLKSDYTKGLMHVDIEYSYKNLLGQTNKMYKSLTNIIDVRINYET